MPNPYERDPKPTDQGKPRRISPLVWLVLLLALLAFGWSLYNEQGAAPPPAEPVTAPTATRDAMTPRPDRSAEREPRTADERATASGGG